MEEKRAYRIWTEEEEKKLRKLSKTMTATQIANVLGRSKNSIDCKRKKMNIQDCMTTTDCITANQVGVLVGQFRTNIYRRWSKAGLPLKKMGTKFKVISEKQLIKFMKEHYELWRASQCDYDFFCKYDWFLERLKAERNGTDTIDAYRKRKEWTPYELSRVKMLWKRGKSGNEIAEEVGRSRMAIYHQIRKFKEEVKK